MGAVEKQLREAIKLHQSGRLSQAKALYRKILKIDPQYAEAHHNLGLVYSKKGALSEAIACFRKATTLKPDLTTAQIQLGAALQKLGRVDEAIRAYQDAIEANPRSIEAYRRLGTAHNDAGNRKEAVECFHKVLQRDPDYASAPCYLGFVYVLERELDRGIACFKQALTIKSDYAYAQYGLGTALEETGDVEGAVKRYQQALQLNPGLTAAKNNLDLAGKYLDRSRERLKKIRRKHSRSPEDAESNLNLGIALWNSNEAKEALNAIEAAIQHGCKRPDAFYYLGLIRNSLGETKEALSHIMEALKSEPENVYYLAAQASIQRDQSRAGRSVQGLNGKRIGLHLNQRYHYRILRPIFEAISEKHEAVLTPNLKELMDFRPDVVIISESQAALLRSRLPEAVYVLTRHGLISKNTSCYASRASDYACLTSEASRNWYIKHGGHPRHDFWITGYVQTDPLFRDEHLSLPIEIPPGAKNVLYAPTWNDSLSSAPMLGERLVELIRKDDESIFIVIKPHPVLYGRRPTWIATWQKLTDWNPNVYLVKDKSADIVPYLQRADLLISDASSVVFQFLALNRPITLINNPRRFSSSHFDPKGIEWQWRDLAEEVEDICDLPNAVQRALKNPESRKDRRSYYRHQLYGELTDGKSAERIAARIDELKLSG